jgi:ATP-dependent protease ClpP protease subunit
MEGIVDIFIHNVGSYGDKEEGFHVVEMMRVMTVECLVTVTVTVRAVAQLSHCEHQ